MGTVIGTELDRDTITLGDVATLGDGGVIGLGDGVLVGRRGEGGTSATNGHATINPVLVTLVRRRGESRAGKFFDWLFIGIGTVLSVYYSKRS